MGDAAETRRRILRAGTAEFAEHGIAGARVDRIAANAAINKSQIYAYFGSKQALFDAVFDNRVDVDMADVPLDADDLPGYVAALYDMYIGDPGLVRLVTWARLERTPIGPLFAHREDAGRAELDAIRDAQKRGTLVDDVAAEDLWSMLVSLAATWAQSAIVHTAHAGESASDHDRRRAALAATARRAFHAI